MPILALLRAAVFILDIDTAHSGDESLKRFGKLSPIVSVRTGSGGLVITTIKYPKEFIFLTEYPFFLVSMFVRVADWWLRQAAGIKTAKCMNGCRAVRRTK